jgi:hypothetical protein
VNEPVADGIGDSGVGDPEYPSVEASRHCLARYIDEYNERRPHQALWNYTPGYVHRCGNKSSVLNHYQHKILHAKEQRLNYNRGHKNLFRRSN